MLHLWPPGIRNRDSLLEPLDTCAYLTSVNDTKLNRFRETKFDIMAYRIMQSQYFKTLWKPVALWWADLVAYTTGDVIKSDMWHNVESVYCYYYLSLLHTVRETNGLGAYVLKNAPGTVGTSDVVSCRHMYINYFWFWQRSLELVTPWNPQHEGLSFTLGSTFHTAETQWRFCCECERGDKTRDELYHHIIFRAMSKLRGKIVDV
jgi:hypothetical protein